MGMTERQRWVLALTSTASLMILLDALVVTTALHAIALDLHASIADLEWTVNAYILPFAVLLMAQHHGLIREWSPAGQAVAAGGGLCRRLRVNGQVRRRRPRG